MTEPTVSPSPKPRKPLWRRLLKWTVRVVVALIVLGVVAWAAIDYWAAGAIRDEVARIRADGYPVTFDDLEASLPKVDREKDAAPYYEAAMALADLSRRDGSVYDDTFNPDVITPGMMDEARHRLEKNRLAFEVFDQAATLPECDYDFGLRYGIAISQPRFSSVRNLANIASLRTRTLALQKRGDQAVASVISSIQMLRIFDRQPVLVAYLLRIGCAAIFYRDIQTILEHGNASPKELAALDKALAGIEQANHIKQVCVAERICFLELARSVTADGRVLKLDSKDRPSFPVHLQLPNDLRMRIMMARTLPVYSRFVEAADHKFPDMIDETQALENQPHSLFDYWSRIIIPPLYRISIAAARDIATLRATRLAVQIEQYRLTHGELPKTLDDLPKNDTNRSDPFTGKELIYRTIPGGYAVYSVGENRLDDGGAELRANDRKPNDFGIAIRVPKLAAGSD